MYSLYVALTTTVCFKEMEAQNLSPKHTNEMSHGKEERFKYSNDGAYEMRIINMGVGEKWVSQSHRPCDIALRNLQLYFCLK